MGNICCGYDEEDYKRGVWYNPEDDYVGADGETEAEDRKGSSFNDGDDDAQYNPKTIDREQKILLLEKTRSMARLLFKPVGGENEEKDSERGPLGRRKIRNTRLKRPSISSTPIEFSSSFSFTPPSFPKSDETAEFLMSILAHHFVFASIDEETKLQFVSAMQSQEFNEGDWVMRQGDVGDYFYIVEEGEVAFHVGGENAAGSGSGSASENHPQVGTGSKGSSFGELALLYNTPRAASIRAVAPLKLFKIDQLTFRSLLMSQQVQDRSNIISLVGKISIFQDLDELKLRKVADAFIIVKFDEGERIVNKGDHGDIFYIIKSGSVKVDDIGHGSSKFEDQKMGVGDCFGERALITGETRAANVTAITECSLLAISKRVCENIIGPLDQANLASTYSEYLRSIPIFKYLERDEIDRCVMHLTEERFEKGDEIVTRGKFHWIQEGSALMMLQEGGDGKRQTEDGGRRKKGVITAGPKLVKLGKGDYFCGPLGRPENGSISETAPASDKIDSDLVINVESNMECLTLLDSDVQRVIGDLGRVSSSHGCSQTEAVQSTTSLSDLVKSKRSSSNGDVLNLRKLKKHRILGIGAFGQVWLVTPNSNTNNTPTPYALKMISKRKLLQQKLTLSVLREKNVMESIDHPFLAHMVSSFQDEDYLYLVMGLVLGGELFDLLYSDDNKLQNENKEWKESALYNSFDAEDDKLQSLAGIAMSEALFYGAGVIDALAYLHNRRITYRDLKPENVLLNEKGYCIVVDLGFAKVVLDKTYTLCGTLEYLAPEVIAHKGHNHSADYWSFGCFVYELLVGQTPFFQPGLDQMTLLAKITKAQYAMPEQIAEVCADSVNSLDKSLCQWKDLISRLLKPNAAERIGNLRNGVEDILGHDWFALIDFNDFRKQSLPAPWVPTIECPLDAHNFENKFGRQEKPEVFRRKLSAKDQDIFKGF